MEKVMGMRDNITHSHYFDIDAETVYTVCDENLPQLEDVLKMIKSDVSDKQT